MDLSWANTNSIVRSFMSESTKLILIDSNVLVYAYDETDEQRHNIAQKLLQKCWSRETTYAISTQNLAEFFTVITKKVSKPLPIETTEQIIDDIIAFSHWKILNYDAQTLQKAMQLYKKTKHHFWDALIVATMLEAGIFRIYTENDADFKQFEEVIVINPFK